MLTAEPIGRRPIGRARNSWKDNVRINVKGTEKTCEKFD